MTTWFLFLFSELFIAWCILFIGSSIVDDPQSLLAHAAGFKSKKLKEHPELYEKVQADYGKDLKKVGLISAVISLVGMLFVISLPQENMIQFANCILLVEIVVFVLNYVRHQNSLKKWAESVPEENAGDDTRSELESSPVLQETEIESEPSIASLTTDEQTEHEQDISNEEDVHPTEEIDGEFATQRQPVTNAENLPPVLGDLVDSIYSLSEEIDHEIDPSDVSSPSDFPSPEDSKDESR